VEATNGGLVEHDKSVTAVNGGYLGGELLPWSRRNPAVNQPENDVGVTEMSQNIKESNMQNRFSLLIGSHRIKLQDQMKKSIKRRKLTER
jgi:hypothetical protein